MTVNITINGENSFDAVAEIRNFASMLKGKDVGGEVAPVAMEAKIEEVKPEPEKKTRKPKEEKVTEPKAEVLAPEKPKYTLQDAIDRAREIAGDGKDDKIMVALKGINTRLGISKVREIPPEKIEGYMKELNAEFPKEAAATSANMFD